MHINETLKFTVKVLRARKAFVDEELNSMIVLQEERLKNIKNWCQLWNGDPKEEKTSISNGQ